MYFGGHRFKTKVPDKRNWIQYEMILCSYYPETGKPTAAIHEKRTRYDDDSFWTTCEYEIYEYDIFGRVIKEHHLSVDESGMPWKDIEQRYEYNDRTGKIIMETVNNLDNDTINPTIFKYCSLKIIECLL